MNRVGLTYFASLTDPVGRLKDGSPGRVMTTWPALLGRLSVARVVEKKAEAPGFSLATFSGDRRALANVERVYAVGLDLDHFDVLPLRMRRTPGQIIDAPTWDDVTVRFDGSDSFSHTTWSSTDDLPRVRVFLRLSRPVTGDEYRRVYAACAEQVERHGFLVDRNASDPSRFWFLPSIPPRGHYRYSIGQGKPVHVENALAAFPEPTRAPSVPSAPPREVTPDVEERAARYLERCEPAISGSDGHKVTFSICQKIVRGFALDDATAYRLLARWNETCQPPWSERELKRKIQQAAERGTMPLGELRDRERAA